MSMHEKDIALLFFITRDEIVSMMAAKLASCDAAITDLEAVLGDVKGEHSLAEQQRTAIRDAIGNARHAKDTLAYMRDHLDAPEREKVSAAQLLELRSQLAPIEKVDPAKVMLALTPDTDMNTQLYRGGQNRRLRT